MNWMICNKRAPSSDTIYVSGGTKGELKKLGIECIPKQDWFGCPYCKNKKIESIKEIKKL